MAELYNNIPLLVVGGPTASGKSSLAVEVAKAFDGEVVSADSMQIFRELNVGTAKISADEMQGVPHYMLDVVSANEPFSVADYVTMARERIEDIASRGKLPILCGGTGLYIKGILEGMHFPQEDGNTAIREQLELLLQTEGPYALHQKLSSIDPAAADNIHPNNSVRVIRAIEICLKSGKSLAEYQSSSLHQCNLYRSLFLCIDFPNRSDLYRRIDIRIDQMMQFGLLKEAELVYQNRSQWLPVAKAIGYKEFFPYFEKKDSLESCVQRLKYATHQYAKRQLTWFRHMPDVNWILAGESALTNQAFEFVHEFLD